nr:RodZ domain-containing protein [Polymorphobacter sp.]
MDTEVTAAGDEFAHGRRVGAVLADARAAAGLEITDIARDTRVPARHLAAIEADAHDSLPALPYAIGFVKAFARAVGIDPEAAGAQFRAETSKVPHTPAPPPMSPLDERRLPPRGLVTVSIIAVLAVIGGVVAWSAGALDTAPKATQPPVVATAAPAAAGPPEQAISEPASAAATGTIPANGPATQTAASGLSPSSTTTPEGGHVVITASEDAWFRISAYDATTHKVVAIKTGVLAKGEHYDVTPVPGQRLWTGRAGALQISVDGRALPSLGGPVETVKNISLDPADLRARVATPVTPR